MKLCTEIVQHEKRRRAPHGARGLKPYKGEAHASRCDVAPRMGRVD